MGADPSIVNDPLGQLTAPFVPNRLAAGIETFPRELAGFTPTMSTGSLRLSYFTSYKNFASTQGVMWTGNTAAAATPTLVKFGLYSVAANGDLTLVASTANDTTLFAGVNTKYTRNWLASVNIQYGQRYAFAALVVSGAAVPTVQGNIFAGVGALQAETPTEVAFLSAQSDLPASIAFGALGTSANMPWAQIL